MNRPERAAAVDYLRRKGTDAPTLRLLAGLRSTFQRFEQAIDAVPDAIRAKKPQPDAWSVHEIVDHLVETHRRAVGELQDLCAGISPAGGPIPARLTSSDPFARSWPALVTELKGIHSSVLTLANTAGDAAPLSARAPFVMVVKVDGSSGPDVLEWIERLDWKAYAQALRVHTHEHSLQVERTVAALRP
jgi:DinB family protein